jgi:TRAP-type C4-dicarboxylate transport system permease small subunit
MAMAARTGTRLGNSIDAISQVLAVAGGMVLAAMALVTVVSVVGRALAGFGLAPVRGDFELVTIGCAVAVFWSLPLAQMRRAHVTVDILSERLGPRVHAVLGLIGNAALTVCAAVVAVQLARAFGERFPHGSSAFRDALGLGPPPFFAETTYELQIEVWIPFGLSLVGAAWLVVVCGYTVWRSARWVVEGREPALE